MASQNTIQSPETELKCSRLAHPEDLVVGDSVAVSTVTYELATFFWCGVDSFQFPPDELIRITLKATDGHYPMTIKSICLPYVLCKRIDGQHAVYDLRQLQLTRLDRDFANAVRGAYKADKKLNKKKKRKSKKKKGN